MFEPPIERDVSANPFEYLVALLVHSADVAADPAAWLPWTFRATLARASPATLARASPAAA